MAIERAGKKNLYNLSKKFPPMALCPNVGKILSLTENIKIKINPSQKEGTDIPN